jgi:hypothetical protein
MQLRIAEEGRLACKLWELESIDENADQMHTNSPELWEATRRTISAMLPVVLTLPATVRPHRRDSRGYGFEPRDSGPLARDRTQQ